MTRQVSIVALEHRTLHNRVRTSIRIYLRQILKRSRCGELALVRSSNSYQYYIQADRQIDRQIEDIYIERER